MADESDRRGMNHAIDWARLAQSVDEVPVGAALLQNGQLVAGAHNAAISMVVRVFGEWSGTATTIKNVENERGRVPAPVTR